MKETVWVLGCIEREITLEEMSQLANLEAMKENALYKRDWLDKLKNKKGIYDEHLKTLDQHGKKLIEKIFPTRGKDLDYNWFSNIPKYLKNTKIENMSEFRNNVSKYKKKFKNNKRHVRIGLIVRNTSSMIKRLIFNWVEQDSLIIGDCAPQNKDLSDFRIGTTHSAKYDVRLIKA